MLVRRTFWVANLRQKNDAAAKQTGQKSKDRNDKTAHLLTPPIQFFQRNHVEDCRDRSDNNFRKRNVRGAHH
jgi:hypothetical protein